jgi:hypothetical protein
MVSYADVSCNTQPNCVGYKVYVWFMHGATELKLCMYNFVL